MQWGGLISQVNGLHVQISNSICREKLCCSKGHALSATGLSRELTEAQPL